MWTANIVIVIREEMCMYSLKVFKAMPEGLKKRVGTQGVSSNEYIVQRVGMDEYKEGIAVGRKAP